MTSGIGPGPGEPSVLPAKKLADARKLIDEYRKRHGELHADHEQTHVPEAHTLLLIDLMNKLEKIGYISDKGIFGDRVNEVIEQIMVENEEEHIKGMGYSNRDEFYQVFNEDKEQQLMAMWR